MLSLNQSSALPVDYRPGLHIKVMKVHPLSKIKTWKRETTDTEIARDRRNNAKQSLGKT